MKFLHVRLRYAGGTTQNLKPVPIEPEEYSKLGIVAGFAAHALLGTPEDVGVQEVTESLLNAMASSSIAVVCLKDHNGDDLHVNISEVASWTTRITDDEDPVFKTGSVSGPFA